MFFKSYARVFPSIHAVCLFFEQNSPLKMAYRDITETTTHFLLPSVYIYMHIVKRNFRRRFKIRYKLVGHKGSVTAKNSCAPVLYKLTTSVSSSPVSASFSFTFFYKERRVFFKTNSKCLCKSIAFYFIRTWKIEIKSK